MVAALLMSLVPLGLVVVLAPIPAAIGIVLLLRSRPNASLKEAAEALAIVLRPGKTRRS